MVSKVNLTGMAPWNFNGEGSEWKQEKLSKGNFAEILAKEQGRLKDAGDKMQQMRRHIQQTDGQDGGSQSN